MFACLGFTGIWGGQLLSVLVLDNLSPLIFSLLQTTVTPLTLLVTVLLGMEALPLRKSWGVAKLVGVFVTLGGAVLVIASGSGSGNPANGNTTLGFVLLVVQVGAGCFFYIFSKRVLNLKLYTHLVVIAWTYVSGAVLVLLSSLPVIMNASSEVWDVSTNAGLCIVYAIVVSSCLSYALLTWIVYRTSPLFTVVFTPVQNVATALIGWWVMDEGLSIYEGMGGLLIATGLFAVVSGSVLQNRDRERGFVRRVVSIDSDDDASHRSLLLECSGSENEF